LRNPVYGMYSMKYQNVALGLLFTGPSARQSVIRNLTMLSVIIACGEAAARLWTLIMQGDGDASR